MTRDEVTKFVAELVAGYDMEPEDAAALHEMGKLAALRAPAVTGEAAERINTRCPSCGSSTLFVAEGGHLTCSLIGCKQPVVERAIAELRAAPPAAGAPPAGDQCRVGESMADDYFQHAAECPECSAYEAARVESIRRGAAGAPPALVALVQRLQSAMRSFKGWTQAGMPRTADHCEDKARAALDDVLAWSPAPAPLGERAKCHTCGFNRTYSEVQAPRCPNCLRQHGAPAPVAPPTVAQAGDKMVEQLDQSGFFRPQPTAVAGGDAPECPNCGGMGATFHDVLVGGTEHDTEERDCEVCKGTGRRQEGQ